MANDETPKPEVQDSVGQQLQRARERKGLSASEVADAQHLRPAVIQAIESGDYNQIDTELFLKGYVRAYARQVGLDPDPMVRALDRELEPLRQKKEQEYEANPLVDIERRRRRKRRVAKVLLLAAIIAVAGFLVFAFVLPPSGEQDSPGQPAASDKAPAGQSSAGQPSEEAPAADKSTSVEEPRSGDILEDVADGSSAAAVEPEPPAPVEAGAGQAPLISAAEPLVEDPSEPVAVADTGRLEISFTADCWVQVSDAEGNRLVNSLQRQGDSVDVTGETPLRVVIGAVDAVGNIRFQGEPLNMGDYRVVNNRSEFTLTI